MSRLGFQTVDFLDDAILLDGTTVDTLEGAEEVEETGDDVSAQIPDPIGFPEPEDDGGFEDGRGSADEPIELPGVEVTVSRGPDEVGGVESEDTADGVLSLVVMALLIGAALWLVSKAEVF